jgi:NAD+ kinase
VLAYKNIGVTVKTGLDHKSEAVEKILKILRDLGANICIDADRAEDLECAEGLTKMEKIQDIDLLLVIGGDGTILRTVREMEDRSIPILSVNRGRVGFLAETHLEEAEALLPKLLQSEGVIEERGMISIIASRGEEKLFEGHALNEAVIAQGTIARLVDLKTYINGEELTVFHADGLILSTPTGSTAYSLAAGGPVVYPTLSAAILTPINPHSFSQRPIVVPGKSLIDIEIQTKENKFRDTEVVLTVDGQIYVPLKRGDRLQAHMNGETVKFIRRKQDTFFETLRTKLKWGDRLD